MTENNGIELPDVLLQEGDYDILDFDVSDAHIGGVIDVGLSGTQSYKTLQDKPSIEQVVLDGDKSFGELGLSEISNIDLLQMYNVIVRS